MCQFKFQDIQPKGLVHERVFRLGLLENNSETMAVSVVVKDAYVNMSVEFNGYGEPTEIELKDVVVPTYYLRVQLINKEPFTVLETNDIVVGSTRYSVEKVWQKISKSDVAFIHIEDIISDLLLTEEELDEMTTKLLYDGAKKGLRYVKGISLKQTFDKRLINIIHAESVVRI